MQIDNSWEMQSSGEIESAACTFKVLGEFIVATVGVWCENLSQIHVKSLRFIKIYKNGICWSELQVCPYLPHVISYVQSSVRFHVAKNHKTMCLLPSTGELGARIWLFILPPSKGRISSLDMQFLFFKVETSIEELINQCLNFFALNRNENFPKKNPKTAKQTKSHNSSICLVSSNSFDNA